MTYIITKVTSKKWAIYSLSMFVALFVAINASAQSEPGNNLGSSYMQLKEQFPDIYPYGEDNIGTVFRAGVKEDGIIYVFHLKQGKVVQEAMHIISKGDNFAQEWYIKMVNSFNRQKVYRSQKIDKGYSVFTYSYFKIELYCRPTREGYIMSTIVYSYN